MWLKCGMFTAVLGIKIHESEERRKLQLSCEHLMYQPDSAGKGTVISHNRTFILESKQRGHLFSFTRAAQAVLFEVGHGPINRCTPVVMGYCKFSPASTLKRKAYLPALMMSPLLSSHPFQQWQDKGLLPGERFSKAQPFFLDSVPIMMDTQRTTSHKASQWTGTHCLYVSSHVALPLITS